MNHDEIDREELERLINMAAGTDISPAVEIKVDLKEPPLFKVIYINDNVTTVEFVISSLVDFFAYDYAVAEQLTHDIHELGAATVAVLPYELAEQKGIEVTMAARQEQFPLQIKLEPEDS
jgi:ATP-dependent Clp protease adaptor protein ClpS